MSKLMAGVFIALLCLTLIEVNARRTELEIYNISCNIVTKRMKRFDCYFRKKAEGQFIVNQYLMFSQNLANDFQARLWIQILPQNADKPTNFIDVTINVCDFLKNPMQGGLLSTLLNEVKRSGNMPRSCPIKGNLLYKFINQSISSALMPPYAPILNFTYRLELYDTRILFAKSKVMGGVVSGRQ